MHDVATMEAPLETARLILPPLRRTDADELMARDNDAEVRRHVDMAHAPARAEVDAALTRMLACAEPGLGFFAAVEKPTGVFLGWLHLRRDALDNGTVELGYKLRRSAWGRGLATEGARSLIARGFTLPGIERVVATALAANAASVRVMAKCGLAWAENFEYKGMPAVRYACIRDAWLAPGGSTQLF